MQPFLFAPDYEARILQLFNDGRLDDAGESIAELALVAALDSRLVGQQIYMPGLDALCVRLGESLRAQDTVQQKQRPDSDRIPLIVVSELYETGGHSRVVEDLKRLYDDAEVVMTGYFPAVSQRKHRLCQGLSTVDALQIPADTLSSSVRRLGRIVRSRASMVFHVAHHHDVVANAALAGADGVPVFFIHHSDHRPCLGATIPQFVHVDIAVHVWEICKQYLGERCVHWPQGVFDYGQKAFSYPLAGLFTATSGASTKFAFEGPVSLAAIIRAAFSGGAQEHFHIGDLNEAQLQAINQELLSAGVAPERLRHVPRVASLWQFLKSSPVNVFIGSAPMHGLRTAIEVQGAGIPILPYRHGNEALTQDHSHYAANALGWTSSIELRDALHAAMGGHQALATAARRKFLNSFSMERLREAIEVTYKRCRSNVKDGKA